MFRSSEKNTNSNDKTYKSISISDINKKDLEDIMRKLEQHHKKSIRIDVALGHILQVYNLLKTPEKYYDLTEP